MSADPGSAFTLFIESGLHAGTVQRLSSGIYTLGSELEADIVLSDGEIKAIHLIVEVDQRGLRLEPLQGSIAIEGEPVALEPGGERHLSYPAAFTIGDVRIRMSAPQDKMRANRRVRTLAAVSGLMVLAVIGIQIANPFGGAFDGLDRARTSAEALLATNEPFTQSPTVEADSALIETKTSTSVDGDMAAKEPPAATKVEPEITLDQAAASLRARLAEEQLSDIDVKTAVDRIIVRGHAEPARMDDWQNVRYWFDGAFGQDILLLADVEPAEKATPPKLAIEAVWSGDSPYLIAGGQRFGVGADIGDGWTIERIAAGEITFRRGDQSFSLTL